MGASFGRCQKYQLLFIALVIIVTILQLIKDWCQEKGQNSVESNKSWFVL